MSGKVVKVSGPLVVATGLADANMSDVVRVGPQRLIGEILTMTGGSASIQVYEETSGLGPGAVVETTGAPMSVELGPGMIEGIYDGIQRPLEKIVEKVGANITRGVEVPALDREKKWEFTPIANKGDKDYFRITIDCLGYRKKRKETLEQLAAKVAKSVIRTGRSQQLEPMNPYERRVIHSAVANIDGVASRSVGEEPYRKIIISSTNPRNNRNNTRGRGPRRDDRRGRQGGRDRRRENFEAKAIDLSTSFEKDYKKPKPEDSMEVGLYGKIEF